MYVYVCINVDMYLDMWVCILGVLLRMCGCVCVCVCLPGALGLWVVRDACARIVCPALLA